MKFSSWYRLCLLTLFIFVLPMFHATPADSCVITHGGLAACAPLTGFVQTGCSGNTATSYLGAGGDNNCVCVINYFKEEQCGGGNVWEEVSFVCTDVNDYNPVDESYVQTNGGCPNGVEGEKAFIKAGNANCDFFRLGELDNADDKVITSCNGPLESGASICSGRNLLDNQQDGDCEYTCGAISACDEYPNTDPGSGSGCVSGQTYRRYCSSTCSSSTNICDTSCPSPDGSSQCNGVSPGGQTASSCNQATGKEEYGTCSSACAYSPTETCTSSCCSSSCPDGATCACDGGSCQITSGEFPNGDGEGGISCGGTTVARADFEGAVASCCEVNECYSSQAEACVALGTTASYLGGEVLCSYEIEWDGSANAIEAGWVSCGVTLPAAYDDTDIGTVTYELWNEVADRAYQYGACDEIWEDNNADTGKQYCSASNTWESGDSYHQFQSTSSCAACLGTTGMDGDGNNYCSGSSALYLYNTGYDGGNGAFCTTCNNPITTQIVDDDRDNEYEESTTKITCNSYLGDYCSTDFNTVNQHTGLCANGVAVSCCNSVVTDTTQSLTANSVCGCSLSGDGNYCDDVTDQSYLPGANDKCDGSQGTCTVCSGDSTDSSGNCETACGAIPECDEIGINEYNATAGVRCLTCTNTCDVEIVDVEPNNLYDEPSTECGCSPGGSVDLGDPCDAPAYGLDPADHDDAICVVLTTDTGLPSGSANDWACDVGGDWCLYDTGDYRGDCDLCGSGISCQASRLGTGDESYIRSGTCALNALGTALDCCTTELVSGETAIGALDWGASDESCGCSTTHDGEICDSTPSTGPSNDGTCLDNAVTGSCCTSQAISGEFSWVLDAAQSTPVVDSDESCGCSGNAGQICNNTPSFGLDQESFWDGVCIDSACATSVVSCDCSTDGCQSADITDAQCRESCAAGTEGFSCDSDVGNDYHGFVQDGACLSDFSCDTSDETALSAGTYYAECATSGVDWEATCDSTASSGGNYLANGLCADYDDDGVLGGDVDGNAGADCDSDGDYCEDDNDAATIDSLRNDCSACNVGDVCMSTSGSAFSADGVCAYDSDASTFNCCTADFVDADDDGTYVEGASPQAGDGVCGCRQVTEGFQCDANVDGTFDGVCAATSAGVDTFWDTSDDVWDCVSSSVCYDNDAATTHYRQGYANCGEDTYADDENEAECNDDVSSGWTPAGIVVFDGSYTCESANVCAAASSYTSYATDGSEGVAVGGYTDYIVTASCSRYDICDTNTAGGEFDRTGEGLWLSDASLCCSASAGTGWARADYTLQTDHPVACGSQATICQAPITSTFCDYVGDNYWNATPDNLNALCDYVNDECVVCGSDGIATQHPDSSYNPGATCSAACGATTSCRDLTPGTTNGPVCCASCFTDDITLDSGGTVQWSSCDIEGVNPGSYSQSGTGTAYCFDDSGDYCYSANGADPCVSATGWSFTETFCDDPGEVSGSYTCTYDNTPLDSSDDCDDTGCHTSTASVLCDFGAVENSIAYCEQDAAADACLYGGDTCDASTGWNYSTTTVVDGIAGYTCTDCAASGFGYYYNSTDNTCYSSVYCSSGSGWTGIANTACAPSGQVNRSGTDPYTLYCFGTDGTASNCDATGCHTLAFTQSCNYTSFSDGENKGVDAGWCLDESTPTCYYNATDVCAQSDTDGFDWDSQTCYGGGSVVGDECYYDLGASYDRSDDCSTSGCTGSSSETHPSCDFGDFTDTNTNCEVANAGADTCYYATDSCQQDTDGWDYSTSTTLDGEACLDCASATTGFVYNDTSNYCGYGVTCAPASGWSGSSDTDCHEAGEFNVTTFDSAYKLYCFYNTTSACDASGCNEQTEAQACNGTTFATGAYAKSGIDKSGACLDDVNDICYFSDTDVCRVDTDGFDWSSESCGSSGVVVGGSCFTDTLTPENRNDDCSINGCTVTPDPSPTCVDGALTDSSANCEVDNWSGDTVDYCAYNTGDSCLPGGWSYTNTTTIQLGFGVETTCYNCSNETIGFAYNTTAEDCYYNVECGTSGWTGSFDIECKQAGKVEVTGTEGAYTALCYYITPGESNTCDQTGCHDEVEQQSCDFTNLVEGADQGWCLDDTADVCYYNANPADDVCGVDNDGFDWAQDECKAKGSVTWNTTAALNSVCFADSFETYADARKDDCDESFGCTIATDLQTSAFNQLVESEYNAFTACTQSATATSGCGDGTCDEDNDTYYCCDNKRCFYSSCDASNSWQFNQYNVSIISPSTGAAVSRSSCNTPYTVTFNATVYDTQNVSNDDQVTFYSPEGECLGRQGTAGSYNCTYNPTDGLTANAYAWNVTYWRGVEAFNVTANATINITGCLYPDLISPESGSTIVRTTCAEPNELVFTLNVTDEWYAAISDATLLFNMSGQAATCAFQNQSGGVYNCTFNADDTSALGQYIWNASAQKSYYATNKTANYTLNVYGCTTPLVSIPVNGTWYGSGENITFIVRLAYDNGTLLNNSVIDITINKSGVLQAWSLTDTGVYDSIGNDSVYERNYTIASDESNLGVWNLTYAHQELSYLISNPNTSWVRVDDINVTANVTGSPDFIFVQGTARYGSGALFSCVACVNVSINDSTGQIYNYTIDLTNGYFNTLIMDKPLRGGQNPLSVYVFDGNISGNHSNIPLTMTTEITLFDQDPESCLDGGNAQPLSYVVSVKNTGSLNFTAARPNLIVYDQSLTPVWSNTSLASQEIMVGQTVNFTLSYAFTGAEATGTYGSYVYASESNVNAHADVVGESNQTSGFGGLSAFQIWKIVNPQYSPLDDETVIGDMWQEYNVTASVDNGTSQHAMQSASVQCSDLRETAPSTFVYSSCTGCTDECATFEVLTEEGAETNWFGEPLEMDNQYELAYRMTRCQDFQYRINLTERSCGLSRLVTVPFYSACQIVIDSFDVITSEAFTSVEQGVPVIDKGEDTVTFNITFRDIYDISNMSYAQIRILDEAGIDVGAWFNDVHFIAEQDQPNWIEIDSGGAYNTTAVWTRTFNQDELRCGLFDAYVFLNNTLGENDTFVEDFVLDRFVPSLNVPDTLIVGSNVTITGSVTTCAIQDSQEDRINLSDVNVTFSYVFGDLFSQTANANDDGSFTFNFTAPENTTFLLANVTNLTFTLENYPGCSSDCELSLVIPLGLNVFKSGLDITPRSKVFTAGRSGDDAFIFTVQNPSNQTQNYTLTITDDKHGAPAAFHGSLSNAINLSLKPREVYSAGIDVLAVASGLYNKQLQLRSHAFSNDNSTVDFEVQINIPVESLIFNYYVVPDLSFAWFILLGLLASGILIPVKRA